MKKICTILIVVLLLFPRINSLGQHTAYQETWCIDNLSIIGKHEVTFKGNPEVVETELGRAVRFDGDGDLLLVDANPVGAAKTFTVEVIFKPEGLYPVNKDPRFVHIQDPADPQKRRVMIELRTNSKNQCYLDGFLLTDTDDLALMDSTLIHPLQTWHHAAVTYENGVFKTYMDGKEELSGEVSYDEAILGSAGYTSLGARMDERNWFTGLIRTLKVTHKALDPADFLEIYTYDDQINNN